jgi:hypothetical protein
MCAGVRTRTISSVCGPIWENVRCLKVAGSNNTAVERKPGYLRNAVPSKSTAHMQLSLGSWPLSNPRHVPGSPLTLPPHIQLPGPVAVRSSCGSLYSCTKLLNRDLAGQGTRRPLHIVQGACNLPEAAGPRQLGWAHSIIKSNHWHWADALQLSPPY